MSFYCFKFRKSTESKNPKVAKTKNRRTILLSKCAVYKIYRNVSKFIKEQQAIGLLNNLTAIKLTILSDLFIISTLF